MLWNVSHYGFIQSELKLNEMTTRNFEKIICRNFTLHFQDSYMLYALKSNILQENISLIFETLQITKFQNIISYNACYLRNENWN